MVKCYKITKDTATRKPNKEVCGHDDTIKYICIGRLLLLELFECLFAESFSLILQVRSMGVPVLFPDFHGWVKNYSKR